jgi:PKD repeat protein
MVLVGAVVILQLVIAAAVSSCDGVLKADFEPRQLSGNLERPDRTLTVSFKNKSRGAIFYEWDFGDGTEKSKDEHPKHTYKAPGVYNVALIAIAGERRDTAEGKISVLPPKPVIVDVVYSPKDGPAPLTVKFDAKTEDATQWVWEFGDGTKGEGQSLSHSYSTPGLYNLKLELKGPGGPGESARTIILAVGTPTPTPPGPPKASFKPSPSSGPWPLTVKFNNTSSSATPATAIWDFGDGSHSNEWEPVHKYDKIGRFTAVLKVSNVSGSDSAQADIIVEPGPIVANFDVTPEKGDAPLVVKLRDTSIGPTVSWKWTFGNGDESSNQNPPEVKYATPGTYTIGLTVTDRFGRESSVSKKVKVEWQKPMPKFDFRPKSQEGYVTGVAPKTVTFFDDGSLYTEEWEWNFGDGSSKEKGKEVSHTYMRGNWYTVTLYARNSDKEAHISRQVIRLDPDELCVADFVYQPGFLEWRPAPRLVQFINKSRWASSYEWNFGDGYSSKEENPTHTYQVQGTYSVKLTASNSLGQSSRTLEVFVGPPQR